MESLLSDVSEVKQIRGTRLMVLKKMPDGSWKMLPRGGVRRLKWLQGQMELTDTPPTKELKLKAR